PQVRSTHARHAGHRAHRPRAGRPLTGGQAGGVRRLLDQAVPAAGADRFGASHARKPAASAGTKNEVTMAGGGGSARKKAKPGVADRPRAKALAPGRERQDAAAKYVYCIVRSRRPLTLGPIGIGADPAEVGTIHYRDLAAVVSDTTLEAP